jgi:hypothetical protein
VKLRKPHQKFHSIRLSSLLFTIRIREILSELRRYLPLLTILWNTLIKLVDAHPYLRHDHETFFPGCWTILCIPCINPLAPIGTSLPMHLPS